MNFPDKRSKAKEIGALSYFTGKPCKRGHVALRQTDNGCCRECGRENSKIYHADERKRERNIIVMRQWKIKNAEKIKEYTKKRYQDPNVKAHYAKYLSENRERYRAYYRVENLSEERLEKMRLKGRMCKSNNSRAANRRARLRNSEGRHFREDIDRIILSQKGKCAHCRKKLNGVYHVDHIKPIKLGGSNWPKNLQCLCPPCNMRKSAMDPIDFAQREGKLL